MKRIILLLVVFMFVFSSLINAGSIGERTQRILNGGSFPKIAVVLAGDVGILSEDRNMEKIREVISEKFPNESYDVFEDKKVYQDLLIVAEERDIDNLDELKRDDFIAVGEKRNYDYIIILPFYNEGGYYTTSGWTNMVSQKITIKARVVDVKAAEYLYRLDTTEQGESGNAFGSPSLVRAQAEGIEKCLRTIFNDLDIGVKLEEKKK